MAWRMWLTIKETKNDQVLFSDQILGNNEDFTEEQYASLAAKDLKLNPNKDEHWKSEINKEELDLVIKVLIDNRIKKLKSTTYHSKFDKKTIVDDTFSVLSKLEELQSLKYGGVFENIGYIAWTYGLDIFYLVGRLSVIDYNNVTIELSGG